MPLRCCTLCAADGAALPGCIYCRVVVEDKGAAYTRKKRRQIGERKCAWCGEKFRLDPSHPRQMYCQKSCYRKAIRAKYTAERGPVVLEARLCPRCDGPFMQSKATQRYCSFECRSRASVSRYHYRNMKRKLEAAK